MGQGRQAKILSPQQATAALRQSARRAAVGRACESGHHAACVFHAIPDSDSIGSQTPIPRDPGQ
jgi:hypothetical protein